MKLPGPHSSHALAPIALYLVVGHAEHAVDVLAPRCAPYRPAVQLVHVRAIGIVVVLSVEYFPGAQAVHLVAPTSEEVPVGHVAQVVEELESWSKVPAWHVLHAMAPVRTVPSNARV